MGSGDKIRILDLLPGNDDNNIHCILRTVGLGDGEQYQALSYIWGDRTNLRAVKVSGSTVEVTEALFAALKRLRSQSAIRSLWVDQLCIYSYRPEMKHLRILRSAPLFREVFNLPLRCHTKIQGTHNLASSDRLNLRLGR